MIPDADRSALQTRLDAILASGSTFRSPGRRMRTRRCSDDPVEIRVPRAARASEIAGRKHTGRTTALSRRGVPPMSITRRDFLLQSAHRAGAALVAGRGPGRSTDGADVIVIGAGLSGLQCRMDARAAGLQGAGARRRGRVGGRVLTFRRRAGRTRSRRQHHLRRLPAPDGDRGTRVGVTLEDQVRACRSTRSSRWCWTASPSVATNGRIRRAIRFRRRCAK